MRHALLASSIVLMFARNAAQQTGEHREHHHGVNEPQVQAEHLAIGDTVDTIVVQWHTDVAAAGPPCVVWGPATTRTAAALPWLAREGGGQSTAAALPWLSAEGEGQSTAAATTKTCGVTQRYLVSANLTAYLYHAAIGPLQPDVRYEYRVEHGDGAVKGGLHVFTAPQEAGAADDGKYALFFGDSGQSNPA